MSDDVIQRAHAFLRAEREGQLRFDGDAVTVKIVIAPDGWPVAPVMVAMLQAVETVLELPDDAEESLHLMVTLEPFTEDGPHAALADRWRIYHGDPPDVRWARMQVDAARFQGHFIDGEALVVPNPLAPLEPALLRRLNAGDRAPLSAACAAAGVAAEKPLAVGIDPDGVDVRRAFDVVRVTFPERLSAEAAESADAAGAALEAALRSAASKG